MASNAWKEEMLNIVNEFISMPESGAPAKRAKVCGPLPHTVKA